MVNFPYHKSSRGDYFPIIRLTTYHKNSLFRTSALIDSGATTSIFQIDVAENLQIDINKGKEIYLGGVGGRIKGHLHQIGLEIAHKKIIAPVVFSYEYTVSFNLLGREGIFKNFKIIFEEKDYLVKLT